MRQTFKKQIVLFMDSILGFSVSPIRFILSIGLLISLLSFSYFLVIIVNAYLGKIDVRGFATIVALITFLFGVVISMLGIIGEYIWRTLSQARGRPQYIIEEVIE